MDIIQQTSQDVPWEDTNYTGSLTIPNNPLNDPLVIIKCEKIQVKKYEDFTYFKLVLPVGMTLSTEKDILLSLDRDDGFRLTIQTPMRINIVRKETSTISWAKWTLEGVYGREPMTTLEQFNELMRRVPSRTIGNPDPNIRWVPDRGTTSTLYYPPGQVTYGPDGNSSNSMRLGAAYSTSNSFDLNHTITAEELKMLFGDSK